MLMLLWRPEFELDGINSGSWYFFLLARKGPLNGCSSSSSTQIVNAIMQMLAYGFKGWSKKTK